MTIPHKEQGWADVEKELEYVATYASPERRAELLRFLKGQFQGLLQQEIDAAYERAATEVGGMKRDEELRYDGEKLEMISIGEQDNRWNLALSQAAEKLRSLKSK